MKSLKARGATVRTKLNPCALEEEESTGGRQSSIRSFFSASSVRRGPATSSRKRQRPSAKPTPPARVSLSTPEAPRAAPGSEVTAASSTPPIPAQHADAKRSNNDPQNKKGIKLKSEKTVVARRPLQQMYLDFGQRNFAKRELCNVCGMMYVHGVQEDIQQHLRVCKDFTGGVPFQASQARAVARHRNGETVVEIKPSDSYSLRKKVAQVRTIVDGELGFTPSDDLDTASRSAYLYIVNKRVVGMVTAELIRHAFILENNFERSKHPRQAMIGIHQLWVHSKFRKRSIATRMVDAAREKMVYSFFVPLELVAFSSPTEAGINFAKRYVGDGNDVLVYDCG